MKKMIVVYILLFGLFCLQLIRDIQSQETGMPHGDQEIPCDQCHHPDNWKVDLKQVTFDHSLTHFPLAGGHAQAACRACHQSLIFSNIGSACVDCHADVHQGELGLRCDVCHTTVNWENRRELWENHNATLFPLVGVHAIVDCEACHYSPEKADIARLPVECEGCHLENYSEAANPRHRQAAFTTRCEECHPVNAFSWHTTTYRHTDQFKLEGGHQTAACVDCHSTIYAGTSPVCYACHAPDYQQTTDPDHVKFGFITECQLCHTAFGWETTTFDHTQASGFALVGAHTQLPCIECHINNQTTGLPRDCYGCHQDDYRAVTDPNHVTNNFDHDCETCHSNLVWSPATFNHANTQFPLTGAHLTLACIDCHSNGYTGTPTDCYSCHQSDFTTVTDPNHVTNNFDHECTICHTTQAWSPATFDHANTQFPLTGAHVTVACIDCHASGYTGTPSDCNSCHSDDYAATQNPSHAAAGFPTTCETCHNTTSWNQTSWDHDAQYFPIYSGRHRGEWNICADCHVDPNNYLRFECIFCHEHNDPIDLGNKHQNVPNYQYNSAACYSCHPTGEE